MRNMIERLEGRRLLSGATHVDQSFTYDEPGLHFESHEVGVVTPSGNANLSETSGYNVEIFEDGVLYTADNDRSASGHFGPNSASVLDSTETGGTMTAYGEGGRDTFNELNAAESTTVFVQ